MRTLVVWPPHVPSYFNAGHHLPTFTIAAYLRGRGHEVTAIDAGALNCTWKEFGDTVFRGGYDAVVLVNEYDVVEGVRRAADYTRQLAPGALIVTVGRLSYQNPEFMQSMAVDAVVSSGDYEAGVAAALGWAARGRQPNESLPGVWLRTVGGWRAPSGPGTWLPAAEWVLPDVDEIPYPAYESLYKNDDNRFCGIPSRRELVVQVARGCPVGCDFCDVPPMQGLRERRITVERTIGYIRECFARHPFEYVAFYAPTFTLDKRWIRQLCDGLAAEPRTYRWKCATTLFHLDEDMVRRMGEAGCIRISVGVETLDEDASGQLPKLKERANQRLHDVIAWCEKAGIELNCFVIVGLPGTTPAGTQRTVDLLTAAGARVRPTLYTPYQHMHGAMSEREVSAFNRQVFTGSEEVLQSGHAPTEFLRFIFGGHQYRTEVMRNIPLAQRQPAELS
ncbi:radical SAM protein [Lentzea sp. NPDC004782]|uniref:B12-binding domain-containing radical SAM protein n=1 Tax=Lentzea sp. NPDC004782 TaxID=3154458 RepID=UPI0033A8117A